MAASITVNTRFAGSPKGTFINDVDGHPADKVMTKVVVYAGGIIDSVRVTYVVTGSTTPVTVQNGGPGGVEVLSFDLGADDKLLAVYGTQLVNPSPWGERHFSQLSFVVVNSSGAAPTTQVYTASANIPAPAVKFELSFPLMTASSYTFQPEGMGIPYLEGIGFSNVSVKYDSSP